MYNKIINYRGGNIIVSNIEPKCEQLLFHIKKCQTATNLDGFTDAGIAGYFIKLPFKWIYKKHFNQVNLLVEQLNELLGTQGSEIHLEVFKEYENEAILYEPSQLGALAYKQYQYRVKYFERLTEQVNHLLKSIK